MKLPLITGVRAIFTYTLEYSGQSSSYLLFSACHHAAGIQHPPLYKCLCDSILLSGPQGSSDLNNVFPPKAAPDRSPLSEHRELT